MVKLDLSEWVRAEDFPKDGVSRAVFVDEGSFGEFKKDNGDVSPTFEIGVDLELGSDRVVSRRRWTMNKTSQRAVAELFGSETSAWVGKPVELFLADTNIGGKMKKVVYARGVPQ